MRLAPGTPSHAGPATVPEFLARHPVLRPPTSTAGAAVTIVLREGAATTEALLIERAMNPADPASGEVALPGGHVDGTDGSLAATALRELREEVGLGAADFSGPLRFVGVSPAPRFRLHVGVFAVGLAAVGGAPRVEDPREVAHVFWLPWTALQEGRLMNREGDRGAVRVLASIHDGHVVWGFTRRVLREFFGFPSEDPPEGPVFAREGSAEVASIPEATSEAREPR